MRKLVGFEGTEKDLAGTGDMLWVPPTLAGPLGTRHLLTDLRL